MNIKEKPETSKSTIAIHNSIYHEMINMGIVLKDNFLALKLAHLPGIGRFYVYLQSMFCGGISQF